MARHVPWVKLLFDVGPMSGLPLGGLFNDVVDVPIAVALLLCAREQAEPIGAWAAPKASRYEPPVDAAFRPVRKSHRRRVVYVA